MKNIDKIKINEKIKTIKLTKESLKKVNGGGNPTKIGPRK